MNKPKTVIQFDSERFYRAAVDIVLYQFGLEVNEFAFSLPRAKKLIQKISSGEVKPDLAIVETMIEKDHTEGERIATKLREYVPGIKIIAYTISPEEAESWADYVAVKSNLDAERTLLKGFEKLYNLTLPEIT